MNREGNRSLFWPLALITVGVIWLLGQMNIISGANLAMLFRLWPLLLIVIGVEILIGGRNPRLGTYIAIGAVVLVIALVLVGPSLGWAGSTTVETGSYSEALNDATSAEVQIGSSLGLTTIAALADSSNLFEADVTYIGTVEFFTQGDAERYVSLQQTESGNNWNFFGGWFGADDQELVWDIRLSPDVPLNLQVNAGVGETVLDLSNLNLTYLDVNAGVGEVNATLPATDARYEARINGGTGSITVTVSENAAVDLQVSGGVGEVSIDVPDGAAVRIDANTGLGEIDVPSDYAQVSGDDNDGVWESPAYNSDARQVNISFNGGIGGLEIR